MKKWIFYLIISIFLFSCSPSHEALATQTAEAWTPTPKPTETPAPEPITGKLFWDANGSGLQDETSFIVPEFTVEDLPYFFELLSTQGTAIEKFILRELVTVTEPDIPSMRVCVGEVCTETDKSGEFTILPENYQTSYKLAFEDPNRGYPEKEFRYINVWKRAVVVEAYEVDGVVVPEQHLNDTETVELDRGIVIISNEENAIGLMQGFLSQPFNVKTNIQIKNWYDLDPEAKSVRNWFLEKKMISSPEFNTGTTDSHDGIDFSAPKSSFIIASSQGVVSFARFNSEGFGGYPPAQVVEIVNNDYIIHTGHVDQVLVTENDEVYRGQIIAVIGKTGSAWVHLHFSIRTESDIEHNPFIYYPNSRNFDPYRDLSDSKTASYWTVDNLLQFPLVEIIE